MKKILSGILAILLALSLGIGVGAAEYAKMQTTERASIHERASAQSDVLATAKEGYTFTPIGSTSSFWKIEFTSKRTGERSVGYILKTQSEEAAVPAADDPAGNSADGTSSVQERAVTVYWVPNGEVYHSTSRCRTLKRSSTIHSGTREESGKPRACKVCA